MNLLLSNNGFKEPLERKLFEPLATIIPKLPSLLRASFRGLRASKSQWRPNLVNTVDAGAIQRVIRVFFSSLSLTCDTARYFGERALLLACEQLLKKQILMYFYIALWRDEKWVDYDILKYWKWGVYFNHGSTWTVKSNSEVSKVVLYIWRLLKLTETIRGLNAKQCQNTI